MYKVKYQSQQTKRQKKMDMYYLHEGEQNFHRSYTALKERMGTY